MITIRPHQVLDILPEETDRRIAFLLPSECSNFWVLDMVCMIALAKRVKPKQIFEFGTWWGEGLYILARNTGAYVTSIDIERQKKDYSKYLQDSQYTRIIEDSRIANLSSYYERVQFVYIDGGHSPEVVEADTKNAFHMTSGQSPSCIVWYANGDILKWLEQLWLPGEKYRIAETHLVFAPVGFEIPGEEE